MRAALSSLLLTCLAAAPSAARATPSFPGAIQRTLNAQRAPDCSICHVGGQTGRGTVNTPFGTAMRARGLVAYDEPALAAALSRMEADKVDSNGNATSDVDELRAGNDPNTSSSQAHLEYGCATAGAGRGAGRGVWIAIALAGLWVLRRRRHPVDRKA